MKVISIWWLATLKKEKNLLSYAELYADLTAPLLVPFGGRALVYSRAFDDLVFFTSQHCHFRSVISLWGKDEKFVINSV